MTKQVLTTYEFMAIVSGSGRIADDEILSLLDPEGRHSLFFHFIHNDEEVRTIWMCKLTGSDEPHLVRMDMSFEDFETLPEVEVLLGS